MDTLLHRLTLGFGLLLAVVVAVYNSISPSWWPFIVGDAFAAILLVYGARSNPKVAAAGWGFACGNLYRASFISFGTSGLSWLLVGLALLFGISSLGLALTIASAMQPR